MSATKSKPKKGPASPAVRAPAIRWRATLATPWLVPALQGDVASGDLPCVPVTGDRAA